MQAKADQNEAIVFLFLSQLKTEIPKPDIIKLYRFEFLGKKTRVAFLENVF
jgi:hypothetical protein